MPKFTEMDAKVTLRDQMGTEVSPVVLINRFTVAPEEVDQLLKAWAARLDAKPPTARHE